MLRPTAPLRDSARAWVTKHGADPFVHQARKEGYISRAAFKLEHVVKRYGIVDGSTRVIVDLGAAPGGWCQVHRRRAPSAQIFGVDRLTLRTHIPGVKLVQGDFASPAVQKELSAAFGANGVAGRIDVVTSDMCPNRGTGGERHILATLNRQALQFALRELAPGGHFVCKLLGSTELYHETVASARRRFQRVDFCKPPASRAGSDESFLVCQHRVDTDLADTSRFGLDRWPGLRRGGRK